MPNPDVVILAGARTPFGTFGGALKDQTAVDLGVAAARGALERSRVSPAQVDHVIFGNVIQSHGGDAYLARHIALRAGCPIETPALTVGRACGSGLQAIVSAAQHIIAGDAQVVLAGGTETMSGQPHIIRGARWGLKFRAGSLEDNVWLALVDGLAGVPMAATAENLAAQYAITRKEQDDFAYRSHATAADAQRAGRLATEIVAVTVKTRGKSVEVTQDEHVKADTTVEKLNALPPAFAADGTVTAGNASGINDGAGAVVVTTRARADAFGVAPMGRVVSWAAAGVKPEIMGIGPVPASRLALQRAGLGIDDLDLIEINEAFAAQYLAVERELGLPRDRTNVNGGAIAIGHPVGASGTRLALTLLHELRRRGGRYGLASLCIGGGQGIAMVVEALHG
jgi:acetyl-CoA acetyltransferase family protein